MGYWNFVPVRWTDRPIGDSICTSNCGCFQFYDKYIPNLPLQQGLLDPIMLELLRKVISRSHYWGNINVGHFYPIIKSRFTSLK